MLCVAERSQGPFQSHPACYLAFLWAFGLSLLELFLTQFYPTENRTFYLSLVLSANAHISQLTAMKIDRLKAQELIQIESVRKEANVTVLNLSSRKGSFTFGEPISVLVFCRPSTGIWNPTTLGWANFWTHYTDLNVNFTSPPPPKKNSLKKYT